MCLILVPSVDVLSIDKGGGIVEPWFVCTELIVVPQIHLTCVRTLGILNILQMAVGETLTRTKQLMISNYKSSW